MTATSKPNRVLMACSGNTCRSPMAEAIMQHILGSRTRVESAGIETIEGLYPTEHAITVMKEMGLDISKHRSQDVENLDLTEFDLVIAMTEAITKRLIELGVDSTRMVVLNVADPYSKGLNTYRSTAKDIERQLRTVLESKKDEN